MTQDVHEGDRQLRRDGASASATIGLLRCAAHLPSSTVRTMREHEHGEPHCGATEQGADWDARYRERDGAMWSGRPNGRLVAEVAALTASRALDVGCGEGA